MQEHHARAAEHMKEMFMEDKDVIAVIFGGSVVKGMERPDSDIDGMIVVTDDRFARQEKEMRTAFTLPMEKDPYPGGYYDIKYLRISDLESTAEMGSEPARNAFVKARLLHSTDGRVQELLERIGQYPEETVQEKIEIFHSGLYMSRGYFWDCAVKENNRYLLCKSACDTVLFGIRMLFAYNQVFFPCHRTFLNFIPFLREKPEGLREKAERLLNEMSKEALDDFVSTIMDFRDWKIDERAALSVYVKYFEKWWLFDLPNVYEM